MCAAARCMCAPPRRRCTRWSSRIPVNAPETNATRTTIAAITTVFVDVRAGGSAGAGSVVDTVAVSRHYDFHVLLAKRHVGGINGRRSDRGGNPDRGESRGERAEPGGEELCDRGTADAVLNARADPRQRERIRLVPQRLHVTTQPLEELFFIHRCPRTGPPVSLSV